MANPVLDKDGDKICAECGCQTLSCICGDLEDDGEATPRYASHSDDEEYE